ncbi:MAG: AMP-binding protein [Gammaproteobacteria bacterium]
MTPDQLPLQRLYHWEKARADEIYLTQPLGGGATRDWTWGQAVAEARRIAAYLQSLGIPKGANVALLSKNCAHWLMCDYAIWMAGYVSVPLYPTLTGETVRQILEHSEAKAIFVGKLDDWESMKSGVPRGLPAFCCSLSPASLLADPTVAKWEELAAKVAPLAGAPVRPGSELATIIYTSGTTGMPKGVMHSFETMAAAALCGLRRVDGSAADRMLSYLPLSHVAERNAVENFSLACGFRVFFAESLDTFARDLQAARPTFFVSVPRLWVKFQQGVLAKMPREKLDKLLRAPIVGWLVRRKILRGLGLDQCRLAIGGAAPMPPALLEWFKSIGLEIVEAYGMTENFGMSHSNLVGQTRPGYVGPPYPGMEHRIDPDTGEVQCRSPGTMLGYFKEPEKTHEVLGTDGWLKTGDKGVIDKDDSLKITGRVKDLFKTSKGKYVAPAPIEDKLVTHPKVEACCVAGANQGQPCALIMLSADAMLEARDGARREALAQSLAEHLDKVNAMLDPHEQMDFIAVVKDAWTVEKGFVTPTMKVKRNVIESTYGGLLDAWYARKQAVVWQ